LRILLTTQNLTRYGGTQMFVADLARKLLQWGHEPIVHSPWLGKAAADLRNWTVAVTSDLRTITEPPDVIIGNYHLGTMTALHQFPEAQAIFICHTTLAFVPKAPRIRRYVAVDEACRSHLVYESGVDARQVEMVLSAVELTRFRVRAELPPRPRRALLFGNQFAGDGPWQAIRTACREEGIESVVLGEGVGTADPNPEKLLLQYDLVFARGRSALEAMATGAATVLAGPNRMATLVTSADVARYRPRNFGRRDLTTPIDVTAVRREIARYDAADAAAVSRTIRETASLDIAAGQFLRIAEDALQDRAPADVASEYAATALYLSGLEADEARQRNDRLRNRLESLPLVGPLVLRLGRAIMRALVR
jgi:hypothetical protein